MNSNTCCFTGHRKLPANQVQPILLKLEHEIDHLIAIGVTDFISGGAMGFDLIAAALIVDKMKIAKNIRLIFALPCKNQAELWPTDQQKLYYDLLKEADEVQYVSEAYTPFCMKKRNQYMVEHSSYCICALLYEKSGTGQTVRYAYTKGLEVINVAT
ncbi:MAG: SLOG family protein [Oscillospiraceae bacterium]|nr:SLOG family protein [Oscillospiraceae bacterium]